MSLYFTISIHLCVQLFLVHGKWNSYWTTPYKLYALIHAMTGSCLCLINLAKSQWQIQDFLQWGCGPVRGAWTPDRGIFHWKCLQKRKNWVGTSKNHPQRIPVTGPTCVSTVADPEIWPRGARWLMKLVAHGDGHLFFLTSFNRGGHPWIRHWSIRLSIYSICIHPTRCLWNAYFVTLHWISVNIAFWNYL